MKSFVIAQIEEIPNITYTLKDDIYYLDDYDACFIVTGVGKVLSAISTTKFILKTKPSELINIGFAGGTKEYLVNDKVLIEKSTYHDYDLSMFGYEKGQVPGYPTFFVPDESLLKLCEKKITHFKKGTLYTGDYFMNEIKNIPMIFDMEGNSISQTAYYFNIPCILIKVISDIVGISKVEGYENNISKGTPKEIITEIILNLIDKKEK
ncbi:MAG: 5'-methylthioadenosine/S-adenosylhomocysteine nucleosidase [Acholeplasmatales bacterium]|jgi:adenosylhomocysteine nucleosidase|nr:5'-methylthioadenosine/S-adenosylhomocysteine nucleosidase [Acholeplasmatales bacterium]